MAKGQGSQQQNQPTGPVKVIVDTTQLTGTAGEWLELPPVRIENDRKKGKDGFYGYSWRVREGKVDKEGYYQLPIVYGEDELVEVRCYSNYDPSQKKVVPVYVDAIEINLNPPRSPVVFQSGQEIRLIDILGIEGDVEKKGVTFASPQGEVRGPVFKAPIIYGSAVDFQISAVSNADPTVSVNIPIHVEPVVITLVVPVNPVELKSRQKIPISDLFRVENDSRNLGVTIIAPEGKIDGAEFEAPEAKGSDMDFRIRGMAKANPTVENAVRVIVRCVQIEVRNAPTEIHAGEYQETGYNLGVRVLNDPEGGHNFTCELKSKEGKLSPEGNFIPPKFVSAESKVSIVITSTFDPSIRQLISFPLKPPLCPICKTEELDADGKCPYCGDTKYTVNKTVKCPRCFREKGWTGSHCTICNYPGPKRRPV